MSEMNMENRPLALRVDGVKKMYKLGQIGGGTLQADLQSWWARKRGKVDPNSKIGSEDQARLVGQTFMALNGVSFNIHQGEAVGIIGGNGAGKSTLLKLISQVTAPTEGEIELFGRVASMLEVGTGFNGEMTGRENVYMNGAILGMTKAEIDAKMEQIIEFSEVKDFIDTPVKRYSSGMYVKLAFSVAAHLDSEIMIMDEVLAVGDMAFQKKCLDKMRDAAKQDGRTVLYVSHNMNTIRQLCDRCIVLDKGKVIFNGDVEEGIGIYTGYKTSDIYYDYSNIKRKTPIETRKICLQEFFLLKKDRAVFSSYEKIFFRLHCLANYDVENFGIRFEITYNGIMLGTTFSNQEFSAKKREHVDLFFSFDTNICAPGHYSVSILTYEKDQYGNQVAIDKVDNAFSFEVIDEENGLVWLPQYWGAIRFPALEVKEIKLRKE